MKTFRIMYWFNSIINECYVQGETEYEAIGKFTMAEPRAILSSIEEVKTIPSYCRKQV